MPQQGEASLLSLRIPLDRFIKYRTHRVQSTLLQLHPAQYFGERTCLDRAELKQHPAGPCGPAVQREEGERDGGMGGGMEGGTEPLAL